MFKEIFTQLLVQILMQVGPALIDIIIKWLQGLTDEQKVALLQSIAKELQKTTA
jgi:hypothetical protein